MARSTTSSAHPSSGMQSSSSSTAQLEFTQAMTDFKVMFPDMEADVIEAVLRANNGSVDATIDNLLSMSADNETEKAIHESDGGGSSLPPAYPPSHPPSYQQATQEEDLINLGGDEAGGASAGPLEKKQSLPEDKFDLLSDLDALGATGGQSSAAQGSTPPTAAAAATHKHSYTHPKRQEAETHQAEEAASIVPTQQMLQDKYEENLRLREEARVSKDSAANAQYLEDERLALMMQNEEFMAELRSDRDFLSALEEEEYRQQAHQQQQYQYQTSEEVDGAVGGRFQDYSGSGKGKSLMMDEAMFKEKLKNMGKTSKRKFTQLASMFSRRKGAKQLLGHAPAPSNDNLLLNAEPLINQEDSEEEKETKTPTKGKYMSLS